MDIRFKGWSVEEKKMYDIAWPTWSGMVEVWTNNKPQTSTSFYSANGPDDQMILLQYTEFNLNDQPIYDGHIIERSYVSPLSGEDIVDRYVVEKENGSWKASNVKGRPWSTWLAFMITKDKLEIFDMKIIGDKYQNPELME